MYGGMSHAAARPSPRNLHTEPLPLHQQLLAYQIFSNLSCATVQNHSTSLPPPPPPLAGRPMLPPSPQFNTQPHQAREPPQPSPYRAPGRDLPAPSPSTKVSSMSISSMLGADPPKAREPSASALITIAPGNRTLPSSAPHTSAGSPTEPYYSNESQYQGSPEAQGTISGTTNRFRAFSGDASQSARSPIKSDSPMNSNFGRPTTDRLSHISPRSDNGALQDWQRRPERHSDTGIFLERPSSQPTGPHGSIEDVNRRNIEINAKQSNINQNLVMRDDIVPGRNRSVHSLIDPFRPQTKVNGQAGPQRPQHNTGHCSPSDDRTPASNYPFLSSSSVFSEPASNARRHETNTSRPLGQKQQNTLKGPWDGEALRRIRDERLGATSVKQHQQSASEMKPRLLDALDNRQPPPDEAKYPPAVLHMNSSESLDRALQQTRASEDTHRNSLALMLDHNRRAGRASPLPQAVQGAQGQTNGPSRDPSIKNEFSKMFAGIGSGVSSSGLAGSGASTPFPPPSPKQGENEQRLPIGNRNDLFELAKSRNGSRMGNKRNRKAKDDAAKDMGGGSRVESNRVAKRARHHHHGPGHQ